MTATLLKGAPVSNAIFATLTEKITKNLQSGQRPPHLSVILVGEDKASLVYIGHKRRACKKIGISAKTHQLDADVSESELLTLIHTLNADANVDGILVQLPLPDHISSQTVIDAINVNKDVDGFHPFNVGRLALRHPHLRPCTPYGIMQLLTHYEIPVRGQNVTIVGVSNIVGRPMFLEFLLARATPTACHRFTTDLKQCIQNADIVVSATGVHNVIDPDWFKPTAVVIDVGMHRLDDGRLCGDMDFDKLKDKVAFLTPVPGGVGPMTVATLLQNTYFAYTLNQNT